MSRVPRKRDNQQTGDRVGPYVFDFFFISLCLNPSVCNLLNSNVTLLTLSNNDWRQD